MTQFMSQIIIHISNDFPDILDSDKTKAVQHLVDGAPEFRHIVYSLNRVDGWKGMATLPFGEDRTAIAYKALPKGILWEPRLKEVGEFIIQDLEQRNIVPDLIHGHKFTVEGLIAKQLADHYKKPFVLNIQGDTDTKILDVKRRFHGDYQKIINQASIVFPFAKWPIAHIKRYLQIDEQKVRLLPVVPGINELSPASAVDASKFLTVFHLDSWNRKNLQGMMEAIEILGRTDKDLHLDVYGRGSPATLIKVKALIKSMGMADRVTLKGPVPNGNLPALMKEYVGFILPSKRESYGLVYAEALFSGLPVLFSKDRGIDGIFETEKIGYACDPFNAQDIADGIRHLQDKQEELKHSIAELQQSGALDIIRKDYILETYRNALRDVLSPST